MKTQETPRRLLLHHFYYIIYGLINYYQSLNVARAMRFAGIVGIALLAYFLFIIFKTNHIEAKYSFIGSVLICTLPAFQVYVSWIQSIPQIYSVLLSALAGLFLFKVFLNENCRSSLRIIAIFFAVLLLVIALNTYQSAAMFYWAVGIIPLALMNEENLMKKRRAFFIVYFSVGVISLLIYFLMIKIILFVTHSGITSRGEFVALTEIPEAIKWFIHKPPVPSPLIHSLNLWSIYWLPELAVITGIIIILGFLPAFKQSILPAIREKRLNFLWDYLQRILLIMVIIPLSYLPSLVVTWEWAPFRTLVSLETTICILFFVSLVNINNFLESINVLPHNYKKMIIPALLFILTIFVVYFAHTNVDKYIAKLQSLEIKYAENIIQEYGISRLSDTSRIYVTECDKSYSLHPRLWDEFGIPSSRFIGLTPMVQLALFNLGIKKKIEIIEVPVNAPLPEDSNVLFIDCTELKYFLDKRLGGRNSYLGFYSPEKWPPKYHTWRWSIHEGIITIPKKGTTIELTFQCKHPDIEKDPVTVDLFLNNEPLDKITFTNNKRFVSKRYYIPSSIKGVPQLLLKVSRTWNPSRYGVSNDNRDLGVAVREIKYIDKLSEDGIGFYGWEEIKERQIPEWPEDMPIRFRWTAMRASMKVTSDLIDNLSMFLHVAHPDVEGNPVRVKIIGNKGVVKEVVFTERGWKKVVLTKEELRDSRILTFQVNRTWNPYLAKFSNDIRNLGVAVAIPEYN